MMNSLDWYFLYTNTESQGKLWFTINEQIYWIKMSMRDSMYMNEIGWNNFNQIVI